MSTLSPVVDLTVRRQRAERAIAALAAAPVRFVPDELFAALQGSWGDVEPCGEGRVIPLAR